FVFTLVLQKWWTNRMVQGRRHLSHWYTHNTVVTELLELVELLIHQEVCLADCGSYLANSVFRNMVRLVEPVLALSDAVLNSDLLLTGLAQEPVPICCVVLFLLLLIRINLALTHFTQCVLFRASCSSFCVFKREK